MVLKDERRKYLKWVNKLVENYQGTDDISEFVVVFPLNASYSSHLDKWIEFALRKRVKELKLDLAPTYSLGGAEAYSFTKTAPLISGIECLTSLCLSAVNISGEMVEQFLSVCPLLERLSLRACHISNLRIVGSSLKLKYLNIEFCSPLKSMQICAPNLKSFHFHRSCGKIAELQVESLSCLVDLHVTALDITRHEMTQFSSYFPQLETFTMEFDYDKRKLKQLRRSEFTKLRHLTFKIVGRHGSKISGLDKFINLSCPYLHKFTVEVRELYGGELQVSIPWDGRLSHRCLKVAEMITFIDTSHEIELAKCLLKTAVNLEKLIVDTRYDVYEKNDLEDEEHREYKPGSRKRAEQLSGMVPTGVELLII